jgi:hypothetical protein
VGTTRCTEHVGTGPPEAADDLGYLGGLGGYRHTYKHWDLEPTFRREAPP